MILFLREKYLNKKYLNTLKEETFAEETFAFSQIFGKIAKVWSCEKFQNQSFAKVCSREKWHLQKKL